MGQRSAPRGEERRCGKGDGASAVLFCGSAVVGTK
jgi:hypothetical protein